MTKDRVILFGSVLALFTLLTYTFVHTGAVLSRYTRGDFIGYIAAFGIELTVALMAWRLAKAKKADRRNWFLWAALVFALLVSSLANIDEGYRINYGKSLRFDDLGGLDWFQAIVGLSVTGLISLLVFAISELVSSDLKNNSKQTRPVQRTETEQPVNGNQTKKERILIISEQNPEAGVRKIAELANVSPGYVSQTLNGSKNGN